MWARTLPFLTYFLWDINREPPLQFVFKYQIWCLTPCCGLEVHYPTQALKSVKDQDNTFNIGPKWARTLPFLIYFYGIFIETPSTIFFSNIKIDISHPAVGLRCIFPPRPLSQLKSQAIPLT
jgi:hypothetical protein